MSETSRQPTWGGRFSEDQAEVMLRFSESVSFDKRLAPFDLECSRAHAAMLCHVGLISQDEKSAIHGGLDTLAEEMQKGRFAWSESLEDVHMNIEQALIERVPEAAKLHAGRSRNDQVATDVRLFVKAQSCEITGALRAVMMVLLDRAERDGKIFLPGYTHLQRAQPVSLGHHLLAYVEMLGRDLSRMGHVADQANWCPLGSGALAGTTLPIDREFTARMLGFVDAGGEPRLTRNSMDAVSDRDWILDTVYACAMIGLHLSRLAEDLILWCSSEFGFVKLPQTFSTGSSLMPQKMNPDAMELVRGKSGRMVGDLQTLLTLVKGLPLTYNRDLQEDKLPLFDACDQVVLSLQVVEGVLQGMEVNAVRCASAVADPVLLATDVVDYLVGKGVPFRKAHHAVGALVARSEELGVGLNEVPLGEAKKIEAHFGEDWVEVLDIGKAMAARERPGMPGPKQVGKQIRFWRAILGGE
ncbi:MAG: argininosuccinate lyase [Opitutae bacterium]|nr:argininosuccinate lyase [Opitutae bacterium]